MKKENKVFIGHILDSIFRISSYTEDLNETEFMNSFMVQDAVIRNFEIIGEATKNLSKPFREKNEQIDWKGMAGFRDKLIHQYFGVDLITVWGTIEEILPDLEIKLKELNFNGLTDI